MLKVFKNNMYSVIPKQDSDTKRWLPALAAVIGVVLNIAGWVSDPRRTLSTLCPSTTLLPTFGKMLIHI
jgi:hypothetical protein